MQEEEGDDGIQFNYGGMGVEFIEREHNVILEKDYIRLITSLPFIEEVAK